ncbi:MAG: response regulator, partial [Pirellulales bacterium]
MTENRRYRALVVDDEPSVRMIATRELSRYGFICDAARDGLHALELLADARYDVVVTDLRMPGMNGHALAVDLLNRPNRPVVVVLTGVTEPRLAKDLIARGVDDILFKPIDQSILASKVRSLVERRALQPLPLRQITETEGPAGAVSSTDPSSIEPAELDARLRDLANIMPISHAALDVVNMANLDTFRTRELTTAIELDASLATELMRIANSALYNP